MSRINTHSIISAMINCHENVLYYQLLQLGSKLVPYCGFPEIHTFSLFFLCRDGEAILEIRGTWPLAGPGADLEIWNSWKKNEMWRGYNMARK